MSIFKLIIISILSLIFLFGNAQSQVGLIKTLARGVQNTVDNAVDMVEDKAGSGFVGHILTGAGNIAKAAIDGTETVVSEADDHMGAAARAAHHSLVSLIQLGNETLKDIASFAGDTGLGVEGVASDTMKMAQNVTGALRDMMMD